MQTVAKHVQYNSLLCCIECSGCGDSIPIGRITRRDGVEFTATLEMAREVHADCGGDKTEAQARRARVWREGHIRARTAVHVPDRLCYSV